MNTVQNYAGGGNYATSTEQTDQNQVESIPAYKPVAPTTQVLTLVRDFCADRGIPSVVEVINNLTLDWTKLVLESNGDPDRDTYLTDSVTNTLFTMNKVTEFIVALQRWDSLILRSSGDELTPLKNDLTPLKDELTPLRKELIETYEQGISLLEQLVEAKERTIKSLEERVEALNAN